MVIKAPQKREIFNFGLSLTYEVKSAKTSALLYGTGANPSSILDPGMSTDPRPIDKFIHAIRETYHAWDHPMLLPCLFLMEHQKLISEFGSHGKVMSETVAIEHQLGVVKVGQSAYLMPHVSPSLDPLQYDLLFKQQPIYKTPTNMSSVAAPRILSREDTEKLTVRINTQSTRVAFTARSPEWNLACSRFVLGILREVAPLINKSCKQGTHDCREMIECNIVLSEAASSNIAVIKERMALQLNVLYNVVAQMDNRISAELAASAGRDSTSMKILAFISAAFLPGSFVAAIFSMNMFDWQQTDPHAVLSDRFWIYWSITVPLTVVTISGWASWWYFELGRFGKRLNQIRGRNPQHDKTKIEP